MRKIVTATLLSLLFLVYVVSTWAQPNQIQILEEARALAGKVDQLNKEGKYEEAIPYAKRLLEIVEKELPKDDRVIAFVLNGLANLYQFIGRFTEAEPFFKRSLEIREKTLPKDHPDLAQSLHNLAFVYQNTGRYAEAEPLYSRSLEIKEKALGKDHPDLVMTLIGLALIYQKANKYREAIPYAERLLGIIERTRSWDHPFLATTLNNLASLYVWTGRYAEAEPLYKRSLELQEKTLGSDHPNVAQSLSNMASAYEAIGRYAEAESLYKRSLETRESVFGKDHPEVAANLNDLALICQNTGRYEEAERLHKRSLEIRERALGKDHPDVAASLNNLALIYANTGRYAEAESLYKRSLEIRERILGTDHVEVAQSLFNLAWICAKTRRFIEAESLFTRSLAIREKQLGKDHPDVAESLNDLAVMYLRTDRFTEAELLLKRTIEIMERKSGKECQDSMVFVNMAVVCAGLENHPESHKMLIRGIRIEDKDRENVFLVLSERQKLNYMEQKKWLIHGLISHTVTHLQTDDSAVRETFDTWLRWKGAVMEAHGRYMDATAYSDNPEIKKGFQKLTNIRREIARLQVTGPEKMSFGGSQKMLEELEKKKESVEVELGRLSQSFALEKMIGKADTKRISEILVQMGEDSVYIDFAQVKVYEFKQKQFGKPRHLAFVLTPGKEPKVKLVDVSDAEETDSHIKAYLEEMKRVKEFRELPRERILKAEAKAIYEAVIKPIKPFIKGKKHLYISPDGNLNLIPFEVLMTPDGKYLLEEYSITYVAAGRDIMRFTDTKVASGDPMIIADPDYDMGLQEKVRVAKAMGVVETRSPASVSRDAKDLRFRRLPDTKQEADAIEKVLRERYKTDVRNHQDQRAMEEVLLTAKEPKVLHLATHGYFLKDEEVKHQQILGFLLLEREVMADLVMENFMLRSGIVLAGANASLKEGRDDGVVSAEKILGLRLKGTDLVVLSACETGVGDVKSGEGVFGLKRSFILSGAKTVVMSLWSIPSKETTELMMDFYTLMAKGKTKAEALREARLDLMKKKPNPFYWGAFVMVGNPN